MKAGLPAFKQLADTTGAVASDLGQAKTSASGVTGQLDAAIAKLSAMTTGKDDPAYADAMGELTQARSSAAGLGTTLDGIAPKATTAAALGAAISSQGTQLSAGLNQLSAGSTALASGIAQLQKGNSQLAAGIDKLGGGGKQLTSGLRALTDGAGALEAGLGQLTNGAGQLATGLSAGTGPTGKLISGLGVMQAKVHKFAGRCPRPRTSSSSSVTRRASSTPATSCWPRSRALPPSRASRPPSPSTCCAAAPPARSWWCPSSRPGDPATRALGDRLHSMSDGFAARTHTQVAVGGPAGNLADFTSVSSEKLPLVVVALALATALLLMLALRSVLVPIVAVALNLFTVAATFGVLTLLFTGSDPLLGGPGYIDAMSIIAIFSATFGLSIAYEVFLLTRMREHVLAGDGPRAAARHALRHTAAAVTGTAAVMVAATIPFLFADLLSVRQFGVAVVDGRAARRPARPPGRAAGRRRAPRAARMVADAGAPPHARRSPAPPHPRGRPPRRASTRPRCSHDHRADRSPDRRPARVPQTLPAVLRAAIASHSGVAMRAPDPGDPGALSYADVAPRRRRDRRRAGRPRRAGRRSRRDPRQHARRVDAGRPRRPVGRRHRGARLQHELRRGVPVRARALRARASSSARTRRSSRRSTASARAAPTSSTASSSPARRRAR